MNHKYDSLEPYEKSCLFCLNGSPLDIKKYGMKVASCSIYSSWFIDAPEEIAEHCIDYEPDTSMQAILDLELEALKEKKRKEK